VCVCVVRLCRVVYPTSLEIREKSGKLIFGHGIMEKVMELLTISGNSVKIAIKKLKLKQNLKFKLKRKF